MLVFYNVKKRSIGSKRSTQMAQHEDFFSNMIDLISSNSCSFLLCNNILQFAKRATDSSRVTCPTQTPSPKIHFQERISIACITSNKQSVTLVYSREIASIGQENCDFVAPSSQNSQTSLVMIHITIRLISTT